MWYVKYWFFSYSTSSQLLSQKLKSTFILCFFPEHCQGDCKPQQSSGAVFAQCHRVLPLTSVQGGDTPCFSLSWFSDAGTAPDSSWNICQLLLCRKCVRWVLKKKWHLGCAFSFLYGNLGIWTAIRDTEQSKKFKRQFLHRINCSVHGLFIWISVHLIWFSLLLLLQKMQLSSQTRHLSLWALVLVT